MILLVIYTEGRYRGNLWLVFWLARANVCQAIMPLFGMDVVEGIHEHGILF
jgi:hypothetical protein